MKDWMTTFASACTSGRANAFVFSGNVRDLMPGTGATLVPWLRLSFRSHVVIGYSLASGFDFKRESDREYVVGLLSPESDVDAGNPFSGLLGAGPAPLAGDLAASMAEISAILRRQHERPLVVVIDYADLVVGAGDVLPPADRLALATLHELGTRTAEGNLAVLVTDGLYDVHEKIRTATSGWLPIQIPLPDFEERLAFIEAWRHPDSEVDFSEVSPEEFAMSSAILTLRQIEDVLLLAVNAGRLSANLIRTRKEEIVRAEYGDVVSVPVVETTFDDVGGLDYIKNQIGRQARYLREGLFHSVTKGILLAGPAGTGKSIIAPAIANELGATYVVLDMAKIFQGLVGATERNLAKLFTVLPAMAPVVVFADEVDQLTGRSTGNGDSGVGSRVFAGLLEFMARDEHGGRIIWIGATNRPDLMDPALLRPGRFDKICVIGVPDAQERAQILKVGLRKSGLSLDESVLGQVVADLDGWTGAEIVNGLCPKAGELVYDGMSVEDAFKDARRRIRRNTQAIEPMTNAALRLASDIDWLPERYWDVFSNTQVDSASAVADENPKNNLRGGRKIDFRVT